MPERKRARGVFFFLFFFFPFLLFSLGKNSVLSLYIDSTATSLSSRTDKKGWRDWRNLLNQDIASKQTPMFSGENYGPLGEIESTLSETSYQLLWDESYSTSDQGLSSSFLSSPSCIERQDQDSCLKRNSSPEASQYDTLHTYMPTVSGNARQEAKATGTRNSSNWMKDFPLKPSVKISSIDSFERQKIIGKDNTKGMINTSGKKIDRKRKTRQNSPTSNLKKIPSKPLKKKITSTLKKSKNNNHSLTTTKKPLRKNSEHELENMTEKDLSKDEEKCDFSWKSAMASDLEPFELIFSPSFSQEVQRYNLDANINQDLINLFSDVMF